MGQIVKRKKKGRPSKADLARRAAADAESDRRRSLRRRNVRYNNYVDYDDYLDEFEEYDEDEDDEEERRRQKKVKLVVKLDDRRTRTARGYHAREDAEVSSSEEDDDDGSERKRVKKRKINGRHDSEAEEESENDQGNEDEIEERYAERKRGWSNQSKVFISLRVCFTSALTCGEVGMVDCNLRRGTPPHHPNGLPLPLPDKKSLELILDKLQKKDTYGVYAEPVDLEEEAERKANNKGLDSTPGTPPHHPNGLPLPLPDKKSLELILDKLQKKDTYGVYAEPVDLEELPDYLDVIDHPMDFATVRKKLGNGSYSTLEQFESDVYLICSNAMQYNSPDTIYHKQARTIQELAKKKFYKLRIDLERSEKEPKSEQKTKPNFSEKKQMKKPLNKTVQEPIGSDFFSGANLATANNIQNFLYATQGSGYDRPNVMEKTVGGISSLVDNNLDKAEELSSGTGILSKFGRKPLVPDEDRRATYNSFNESVTRSESVFATFQNEIKQLVAVGLHAECSYARSLARFAATLGPVAWKVASQRIERALPPGCKFGRGWVGEYEPLPTPVLLVEQRESVLFAKSHGTPDVVRGDISSGSIVPSKENLVRAPTSEPVIENHVGPPTSDNKSPLFRPTGLMLEGRSSIFSSSGSKPNPPIPVDTPKQKQNLAPSNFGGHQHKASKQVELNLPPSNFQHDSDAAEKKLLKNSEMASLTQKEMSRTVGLLESVSSKQPDNSVVSSGGLQNGKVSNSTNSRMIGASSNGLPHQMAQATTLYSKGQEQVLNDPVEAMRASAEKAQKHQNPSNQSSVPPTKLSQPPARDDSSDAAATAARAWMSIGSAGFKQPTESSSAIKNQISVESLYNPTRQQHPQFPRIQGQFSLPPGMQFQVEKNGFPFQAFMRPPDGHFQNRPMIFPQFGAADLARLQMQSQWRGLAPHSQPKQKQEMLPPDLNIGFQSPDSPVKQSSGVVVDSKQPDLALQL